MPLASAAADRPSRVNDGAAHRVTAHKCPVRRRQVVEPIVYTVEGRQTADLRALIRKAKPPLRSCGRSSLFYREGQDAWSVRRHEGGGYASYPVVDDDRHTRPAI